jgi:hypothetical protein
MLELKIGLLGRRLAGDFFDQGPILIMNTLAKYFLDGLLGIGIASEDSQQLGRGK